LNILKVYLQYCAKL